MGIDILIYETLCQPTGAISYSMGRKLASLYPEKAILEGDDYPFNLEYYAGSGHCSLQKKAFIHSQISTGWNRTGGGTWNKAENVWFEVFWGGHNLDVLLMRWHEGGCTTRYYWILSDAREIAESFYQDVCRWYMEVRGEVLVFDSGDWYKSEDLFQAIKGATFDNLILPGTLKEEIRSDFAQFFASRGAYERYRIPWKRGVLFIGPPGNGKTHTVKSLINWLGQPCLYVKSFKSSYGTDHDNIRQVFQRARQTTPCILVLEDLDSLVDDKNRSFFLNELDGFASNTGIVTLATTNHPERLDPAILERPSRFDRKYHFELPGPCERSAYITLWNDALEPDLRLSDCTVPRVVEMTEEFSYAYLKELFLSSMMRWINSPQPGGMDAVLLSQVAVLREQMQNMLEEPCTVFAVDDEEEE